MCGASECSFSACGTLCLHLLDHRDENHCEKSSEKKCRHYVPPVLLGLKSIFMATLLWNKTESILFFLMSLILLLSLCVNQAFLLYIWTILSEERRKSVDRWTHDGRDSLGSNPHLVIHHLQKNNFSSFKVSHCHISHLSPMSTMITNMLLKKVFIWTFCINLSMVEHEVSFIACDWSDVSHLLSSHWWKNWYHAYHQS